MNNLNNIDLSKLSKEELIQMVLNLQDQQEEIIKDELTGFFRRDKLKKYQKTFTLWLCSTLMD